jgi:hypothetical protein
MTQMEPMMQTERAARIRIARVGLTVQSALFPRAGRG